MANKYDYILGEYRQDDTVDLSGYLPYTGATPDLDMGSQSIKVQYLLDQIPLNSIGIDDRKLYASDGTTVVANWTDSGGYIAGGNGFHSINLNDAYLYSNSYTSIDWANRRLVGTDGSTVVADWNSTGSIGFGMAPTSAIVGVNYSSAYVRLGDGSNIAGVFENGGNIVNLAGTGNALDVTGPSVLNGSLLVNETSPYDNSTTFEVNGKGGGVGSWYVLSDGSGYAGLYFPNVGSGFYLEGNSSGDVGVGNVNSFYFNSPTFFYQPADFGGNAISNVNTIAVSYYGTFGTTHTAFLGDDGIKAAGFSDGTNSVDIANGTDAINSTGNVKLQGLSSGAGAPATILTNFNLYVDTATGIVYVD